MPTYTYSGKIVNQNQEPIEGVSVVFVADGIGGKYSVITDSTGNYILHPPESCTVWNYLRKELSQDYNSIFNPHVVDIKSFVPGVYVHLAISFVWRGVSL